MYFFLDGHSGDTYGYLHSFHNSYWTTLLSVPNVYDFGYWNSSDGPKDTPEEQWTIRQRLWDRVLPTNGSLTATSLQWSIGTTRWEVHRATERAEPSSGWTPPEPIDRAKKFAVDTVLQQAAQHLSPGDDTVAALLRVLSAASDPGTPTGTARDQLAHTYAQHLRQLTVTDLLPVPKGRHNDD